ncbi:hypothetical protein VUR80DRAFT_631 [Thermomyces stellatus]
MPGEALGYFEAAKARRESLALRYSTACGFIQIYKTVYQLRATGAYGLVPQNVRPRPSGLKHASSTASNSFPPPAFSKQATHALAPPFYWLLPAASKSCQSWCLHQHRLAQVPSEPWCRLHLLGASGQDRATPGSSDVEDPVPVSKRVRDAATRGASQG